MRILGLVIAGLITRIKLTFHALFSIGDLLTVGYAEDLLIFTSAAKIGTRADASNPAAYATGGAYSLDGVHPTARGYAVIANQIIEDINNGFGANIPVINPGAHTTIFFK